MSGFSISSFRVAVWSCSLSLFVSDPAVGQCLTAEDQKLLASDAAAGAFHGFSASVDGDVALVGAPLYDGPAADQGQAYVLRHDTSSWIEDQTLTASDAGAGDFFGRAVSVRGDLAVVGAPNQDDRGSNAGAVYVFRHDGISWVEEQRLQASDAGAFDYFGISVTLGDDEIAIGAPGQDGAVADSGAVYLFRHDGTLWNQVQKIRASDGNAGDSFGNSVSMGAAMLVVGAPSRDAVATNAGAAYLFRRRSTGVWKQRQALVPADIASADFFGTAVTTDGVHVAVSSERDDDQGFDTGSVYMYEDGVVGWLLKQKLTASDATVGDRLGRSLDLDGDRLVVGAGLDDDAGPASGSAYAFRDTGAGWVQTHKLRGGDVSTGDEFGQGLALSGDRVLAGAHNAADAGAGSGAVYLFELADLALTSNLGDVPAGAFVLLSSCGVLPSGPTLLVTVDGNGLPLFQPVAVGLADPAGTFSLGTTVPSGLAGLTLQLQTFGAIRAGKVGISRRLTLTFQ